MTQEEKDLLLKDLCARLPYGVKIYIPGYTGPQILCGIDADKLLFGTKYTGVCEHIFGRKDELHFKPYLRPLSSMTEDEQRMLDSMCNGVEMVSRLSGLKMFDKAFEWLNKNHFDYRGLIEKGLALEAPKDMYKED